MSKVYFKCVAKEVGKALLKGSLTFPVKFGKSIGNKKTAEVICNGNKYKVSVNLYDGTKTTYLNKDIQNYLVGKSKIYLIQIANDVYEIM